MCRSRRIERRNEVHPPDKFVVESDLLAREHIGLRWLCRVRPAAEGPWWKQFQWDEDVTDEMIASAERCFISSLQTGTPMEGRHYESIGINNSALTISADFIGTFPIPTSVLLCCDWPKTYAEDEYFRNARQREASREIEYEEKMRLKEIERKQRDSEPTSSNSLVDWYQTSPLVFFLGMAFFIVATGTVFFLLSALIWGTWDVEPNPNFP
jgi:hypothetical protein